MLISVYFTIISILVFIDDQCIMMYYECIIFGICIFIPNILSSRASLL